MTYNVFSGTLNPTHFTSLQFHRMLYNVLSMGRKTPKIAPSPWDFVTLPEEDRAIGHRQHAQLECGPMPNVMAALPNIVGALCSTPQSLADARYWSAVQ